MKIDEFFRVLLVAVTLLIASNAFGQMTLTTNEPQQGRLDYDGKPNVWTVVMDDDETMLRFTLSCKTASLQVNVTNQVNLYVPISVANGKGAGSDFVPHVVGNDIEAVSKAPLPKGRYYIRIATQQQGTAGPYILRLLEPILTGPPNRGVGSRPATGLDLDAKVARLREDLTVMRRYLDEMEKRLQELEWIQQNRR